MRLLLPVTIAAFLGLLTAPSTSAQEPQLRVTLKGQIGPVISLAFSPDGQRLALGNSGGTIQLWDLRLAKVRATLTGHTSPVWSVAYSPDGKALASGSGATIRLATPDGKIAGSGSGGPTIKLWDARTGKERATLRGHTNPVSAVAFSPDGQTLASGSHDQTVKLWDVRAAKERVTLRGHPEVVRMVAYSPDGRTLASGSADGTIKLWDVPTAPRRWRRGRAGGAR